jgi:hypothetical protein
MKLRIIILAILIGVGAGCVLITDQAYTRPHYSDYVCTATLVDTATGERRRVSSSMLGNLSPRPPARTLFDFDWNGDGTRNETDVRLDWRRYISQSILTTSTFAGRSWCVDPNQISCTLQGHAIFRGPLPGALPATTPPDCSMPSGPQLEVTAPGLTSDNQLSFPDTNIGRSSATVTFTVTNRSTMPLRVNSVDFSGGADRADFVKTADSCQPTAAEMAAGRGHLLAAGAACTFDLQFGPQHRDGVPECAGAPNESCRRRATLLVTGEVDSSRSALAPVTIGVSGHAIGGVIATEPTEVCFPTAPALGSCTAWQTLRIRNTSSGDLTLTSARLTRAGNRFEAPMPFLMPFTLPAGLPLDVNVRFCNDAGDPTDGEFTINSSSPVSPTTVVTLVNPLRRTCP